MSLRACGFALLLAAAGCGGPPDDLSEASIAELHDRMQRGELTSEALVHWYRDRIETIDRDGPRLNAILELNPEVIYAEPVNIKGCFPTRKRRFSEDLTGDHEADLQNDRTKWIPGDGTGSRCASNTQPFLLQTYKRDTGEVVHQISVPIYINGRHWGGFRIGYRAEAQDDEATA